MAPGFIQDCERDQLHLSGHIQAHGAVLITDWRLNIQHVSDNIADWLKLTPPQLLQQPLPASLQEQAGTLPEAEGRYEIRLGVQLNGLECDLLVMRLAHSELAFSLYSGGTAPTAGISFTPPKVHSEHDLEVYRQALCETIQQVTGADRALYYEFLPAGDGQVKAESVSHEDMGSYLNLCFPASDIPQIARRLYVENPWRQISDARAEPVPLHSAGSEDANLTYIDLRSVADIHREYMSNMGICSSVSWPLTTGQELTALISVHFRKSPELSLGLLQAISEWVVDLKLATRSFRSIQRMQELDNLQRDFKQAIAQLEQHDSFQAAWPDFARWLMSSFGADGVVLCYQDQVLAHGLTFEPPVLDYIDDWFMHDSPELIHACESLYYEFSEDILSQVAGFLAVRQSGKHRHAGARLYICRAELVQEINWGGNPNKPADFSVASRNIKPRQSFEAWLETRLGYCRPWPETSRIKLLRLRELLNKIPYID